MSQTGCGLVGVGLFLPFLAIYLFVSPPGPEDYVPVEARVLSTEVMYQARGRNWLVIQTDGPRLQAEWPYLRAIGYDARELADALAAGELVTFWVEDPDARTPRIRGIRSSRVNAPVELGVRTDKSDRRSILIIGLLFGLPGAYALLHSAWQAIRRRSR